MARMFGHHPWTVQELVDAVSSGRVRLPDIQRPFVWKNAKVRDLVDSMYQGFPVGELMFWESRDGDHTKQIGHGDKTQEASMQIIDGQQRLTSLYAVLKGLDVWREDYSRERIKLAFNPLLERFEVTTPVFERSAEWIPDIVAVFDSPIKARSEYLASLSGEREQEPDGDLAVQVEQAINRLHQVRDYLFQVVQLRSDVDRETVANIFVRINSKGDNLGSADFILTWMSVFWEEGRNELEEFARDSRFTPQAISQITSTKVVWTPHNPFISLSPDQIVRLVVAVGLHRGRLQDAYHALEGRDPHTRTIHPDQRSRELERLKEGQAHVLSRVHWDEFLKVLEHAGFRSKEMITSQNTVLYTYALWLIGRVRHHVPIDRLREMMACWFFMSQLTGRYTSSPETRIQEDISRLDAIPDQSAEGFITTMSNQIETAVPPDWWKITLPENLHTSSTTAPAYVGYIAALNVLDADALLSTMKVKDWLNPAHKPVKGVERHHLFPKEYLKTRLGVSDVKRTNQVANYALVEWSDNVKISDNPPHEYWPRQIRAKRMQDDRLKRQREWHALPDEWTAMDYDEFLRARRRLMAHITHEGFKRLTDPDYEPDLTLPPMEPSAAETSLPSLESLVVKGWLPEGTLMTPHDDEDGVTAETVEDGKIQLRGHLYDSVERAARDNGSDLDSGWDYWAAHLDGERVILADLRKRASAGEQVNDS